MRGTRYIEALQSKRDRIIPAHAGNSSSLSTCRIRFSDHPRACGELTSPPTSTPNVCGSSPRMRGTPEDGVHASLVSRIIPAHAGNSIPGKPIPSSTSDHPRACGELAFMAASSKGKFGSSPRMRGTPGSHTFLARSLRIIPAHAGNFSSSEFRVPLPTDHPRACGELIRNPFSVGIDGGSSPRMRGTQT